MNKNQITQQVAQDNRFIIQDDGGRWGCRPYRAPVVAALELDDKSGTTMWTATIIAGNRRYTEGTVVTLQSRNVIEAAADYEAREAVATDAREEREAAKQAKRDAWEAAAAAVPEHVKQAFQWEAKSAEDGYAKRGNEVAKAAASGDWEAVATASEAMAEAAGRLDAIRRVTAALNAGGMDAARRAMLDVLMGGNGITHMGAREAAAQQFRSGRIAMVARIDSMVEVLG